MAEPGLAGPSAGADIRSDRVMYSDWCLQSTVMNIKINQSIIASTPVAKKLCTVLMEILFYAHWQTQQNSSVLTFSNGAKKFSLLLNVYWIDTFFSSTVFGDIWVRQKWNKVSITLPIFLAFVYSCLLVHNFLLIRMQNSALQNNDWKIRTWHVAWPVMSLEEKFIIIKDTKHLAE